MEFRFYGYYFVDCYMLVVVMLKHKTQAWT